MYNRLYEFLESRNVICDLQCWFKHSTYHALIRLTDQRRDQLDKENFDCGRFADFQKSFDAVDRDILI